MTWPPGGQQSGICRADMVDLLEVAQLGALRVAGLCRAAVPVASAGSRALIRRTPSSAADLSSPSRALPSPVPPSAAQRHHRPGPLPATVRRHADEVVTDHGHNRGLAGPGGRNHLRNSKHGMRLVEGSTLVPDADRLVEVVIVEVAQSPRGHAREYLHKRSPGIARMGGSAEEQITTPQG
jgi:hypothetical protein